VEVCVRISPIRMTSGGVRSVGARVEVLVHGGTVDA
jgi:hypothetical protein